jgi:hypothetical protein
MACRIRCFEFFKFKRPVVQRAGQRKPYSTSVVLRERSPLYMAAELTNQHMAFVQKHQRILGQVVGQVAGGDPGCGTTERWRV